MARTVEQIVQALLGDQTLQLCAKQAQIESLQEQLTQLQAQVVAAKEPPPDGSR